MKIRFTIVFLVATFVAKSWGWTPKDQKLYINRHFIELEHVLITQNKPKYRQLVELQERDLKGCKAIHFGSATVSDFLSCIRFMNREFELNLFTPGREKLIDDLNILCKTMASQPNAIRKVVSSNIFKTNRSEWNFCLDNIWKQVYLTIYANFDADPVGNLALFRKSQHTLNSKSLWAGKALAFISTKSGRNGH